MEILQNINWVDVVVALILIRSIYLGAKSGLTAELFKFIGTLFSLTIGIYWYSQLADFLIVNINMYAWLAQFICFAVINLLIKLIFKYGVTTLLKILNMQFMPQLERVGGLIVGCGRGIITAGILLLALSLIPTDYIMQSIYTKSYSGRFLVKACERTYKSLTFWLPEEKANRFVFFPPSA